MMLETAVNAELVEHLGYDMHEIPRSDNSRNGYSAKTTHTEYGKFELKTPHDRNNVFEQALISAFFERL